MDLSHLSGPALDFWTAKALEKDMPLTGQDKYGAPILNGKRSLSFLIQKYAEFPQAWSPSTKWEDGGPIIERYGIRVCKDGDHWEAAHGSWHRDEYDDGSHLWGGASNVSGPTPLIAAMRCFVLEQLGSED